MEIDSNRQNEEIWNFIRQNRNCFMDVNDDLKCSICKNVLINAQLSECNCSFCRECLLEHLKTSKRCVGNNCFVYDINIDKNVTEDIRKNAQIKRLKCKCPTLNCNIEMCIEELIEHIKLCSDKKCPFVTIGCNFEETRQLNIENHITTSSLNHNKLIVDFVNNLENKITILQSNYRNIEDENKTLRDEVNEFRNIKDEIEIMKQNQHEDIERLQGEYIKYIDVIKNEFEIKINETESKLELYKEEIEQLKKENCGNVQMIKKIENENKEMKSEIRKVKKESEDKSKKYDNDIEKLKKESEEKSKKFENENKEMKNEIGKLKKESEDKSKKFDNEIEKLKKESEEKSKKFENENKELTNQVAQLKKESEEKSKKFENENKELTTQVAQLKKESENKCDNKLLEDMKNEIRQSPISFFVWRVDNIIQKREDAKLDKSKVILNSDPFFTKQSGYKLRLRMDPNGDGAALNTHLSLFLQIMRSGHDEILAWPCTETVKFSLIDTRSKTPYKSHTFSFKQDGEKFRHAYIQPTKEFNKSLGQHNFVSWTDLLDDTKNLMKDGSIYIKVDLEK